MTVLVAGGCGDAAPGGLRVDPSRVARAADVGGRLVSIAVDLDQVTGGTFWDPSGGSEVVPVPPYDFDRPRLRRLAAALAPAYLRIGGSAADRTFYDLGDSPAPAPPAPYVTQLTRREWDGVSRFARELGFDVILTLNAGAGPRQADGSWSEGNARELLSYVAARGDPVRVVEFGNEPNLFALRAGVRGYDAAAYARDLSRFRSLRDAVLPAARLAAPGSIYTRTLGEEVVPGLILGPRMADMLARVGSSIDLVSYHYYAAISTRCAVEPHVAPDSALEADYLDGIDETLGAVASLRDELAPGRPIWLTESGGQSCGGQIGVADRFVNSFWYLNTLGRLARAGHEVFVRWTLSGSTYGLIDDESLTPRPDYWAALLWSRTMGGRSLVLADAPADPDLRVFAHCARSGPDGAVTLLVLNASRSRELRIDLVGHRVEVLLVTAGDASGATARLNGELLSAADDGEVPETSPRLVSGVLVLPPESYAFATVPDAEAGACTGQIAR